MPTPKLELLTKLVRSIERETEQAISLYEAYKPAASNRALIERYNDSYAAWTFNTIRESLHRELVLTLIRLWDTRTDVASIPAVMERLESDSTVSALCREAAGSAARLAKGSCILNDNPEIAALIRQKITASIPDEMTQRNKQKRRQLSTLRGLYTRACKLPELGSLRRHRHQVLAHTALDASRTMSLRPAKWGDEQVVLRATVSVAQQLSLVVDDHDPSLRDLPSIYRRYAAHYWELRKNFRTNRE